MGFTDARRAVHGHDTRARDYAETPLGGVELSLSRDGRDSPTFVLRRSVRPEGGHVAAMAIAAALSFLVGLATFVLVLRAERASADRELAARAAEAPRFAATPMPDATMLSAQAALPRATRFVPTADVVTPPDAVRAPPPAQTAPPAQALEAQLLAPPPATVHAPRGSVRKARKAR